MSRCAAGGQGRGWVTQKPDGSELVLACRAGSLGDTGAQSEEEAGGCNKSILKEYSGSTSTRLHSQNKHLQGMGRWGDTWTGQWADLGPLSEVPHTAPRGLGTKLRMPDATVCSIPTTPPPSTPIQDPTGRREGGQEGPGPGSRQGKGLD